MKFLIDECLSEELATSARARGHSESSHVVWIGKRGAKDWSLMPVILDGDWTFVTLNAYDFRGPAGAPGTTGHYAKVELHAGLVCLAGRRGMDLDLQIELFEAAMDQLEMQPDLINQVLEVVAEARPGELFTVRRYKLPT
ncbi:MAG TPA: DUF5615 family PIN-like protein [Caulobacteraceae bacterium]|nr:DUF5615 family PIN-like protein [Caulobacteraceae bacterium]